MASYQYLREITENDLAPEQPVEYTRKQKLANWWHYHWKLVLGGVCAALLVASFAKDVLFRGPQPDHVVGLVTARPVPEELCTVLQQVLAPYADDRNGDGKTVLEVRSYPLNFGADVMPSEEDMYAQMAASTRLSADFQNGEGYVFLVQDPAGIVGYTQAMQYLNGTLPPEVDVQDAAAVQALADQWPQMFYAWGDCPVLAGLPLQPYTTLAGETADPRPFLEQLYVGRRGIWTEQSAKQLAGCDSLWQALTAGATPLQGAL